MRTVARIAALAFQCALFYLVTVGALALLEPSVSGPERARWAVAAPVAVILTTIADWRRERRRKEMGL